MQSILITGGLGYIGSITITELYKAIGKQYKIIILDNLSNSKIQVLDSISSIIGEQLDLHIVDIQNYNQLSEVFNKYKETNPINYIIHFAALKAVGESVENPIKYYQNNVVGTLNLLRCAEEYKCQNFLFSSSATVYAPGEFVDEEAPFKPSNPYGETKVTIEYLIKSLSKKGGRYLCLRYFNPVGATKDGKLGEMPNKPNNLFPYIEQVAIGNLEQLYVFGNDYNTHDGTGIRDYIHVLDLAEAHVVALQELIKRDEKNENYYDYFNIGTGKGFSVLDIVNEYSKLVPIKYQITNKRVGDVAILVANPNKTKEKLGWIAKRGLTEMCQDSYNFIKSKQ
ncbi:unnamed protein product [Paramecium primaurelia]|uniref:UDP-glucose 4-epimerase n=1 Tax=Paramecium primaurelia TaxID=5886 RepID=A0A8S1JUF3_PARPR|nr:unnamed protein product [Paramecium primaurelia]